MPIQEANRCQCPACAARFFRNPAVGVAVVLVEDDRILLGQRSSGHWCIPCGHAEWGESVDEAARREFQEETGLVVEIRGILSVHTNRHDIDRWSVGIWFAGRRLSGSLSAADDLRDARFFGWDELPTFEFPTDRIVIDELLGRRSPRCVARDYWRSDDG